MWHYVCKNERWNPGSKIFVDSKLTTRLHGPIVLVWIRINPNMDK